MPDELDLLRELGRELVEPHDESVARARALLEQRSGRASHERPRRRARLRWAPLVATVALLVGSGLGFGVGSSVTPRGSAHANVVGLGFIPAEGWNVVQRGAIGETGVAHAIAANVPIASEDEARDLPSETLRRLSPSGVVIVARFSPRGDLTEDARFPVRSTPLRVSDAARSSLPGWLQSTTLVPLRLRAAVGGYNVDARVFVGRSSPAASAAVDEQLQRLVVAPSRVTLVVQPTTFSTTDQRMTIFGSVDSGKAGEMVTIQFKACGLQPVQFRDAFETTTQAGGGFSLSQLRPFNLGVSGVYRAVSGDDLSAEVRVQQRAAVYLTPQLWDRGRFKVRVWGKVSFWRRFVLLQRFERARGVWITLRRVVLTEDLGSTLPFRPRVPKGALIRAVFPLSQARPCYLAGVSPTLRV